MFFHLVCSRNMRFTSYLSDINSELIAAYKFVKNNVRELLELLKRHQRECSRNPSEYYYKLRDDRTARFIALNKTRIFNVPIGRYKNPLICNARIGSHNDNLQE